MTFKNLSQVVLDALSLHASCTLPSIALPPARQRLVVASGNALPTARILFPEDNVTFCSESGYHSVLDADSSLDASVVVSASGSKSAPQIIDVLSERGLDPWLVTCDASSPAATRLEAARVITTRSQPEPITYNTSSYMGMILSKTREDAAAIRSHIVGEVAPLVPSFASYEAFFLVLRPEFDVQREMFVTKFDELFGGRVNGRCYTDEQTLHAKTVVPWQKELFLLFDCESAAVGDERLSIPLPAAAGPAAMMAVGYYVVGRIQEAFPAWFRDHMPAYLALQPSFFEKPEV